MSNVSHLKARWEDERRSWSRRDLSTNALSLTIQPRPQPIGPQMLPVIYGAAVYLSCIRTSPDKQRRWLRVAAPTLLTPMTPHTNDLASVEKPGPSLMAAPFACHGTPTVRTPPPAPFRPEAQRLYKDLATFDNVHMRSYLIVVL